MGLPMVPLRCLLWSLVLAALGGCSAPEPLKVGLLAGLTGPGSELGSEIRRALELSIRDLNRAGGVAGHRLELVVADDGNDPQRAVLVLEQLRRQGICALIGPSTSAVLAPVLSFVNQHQIPTLSPTVGAVMASGQDDWFFRLSPDNTSLGRFLGDHALLQGLGDVAVLQETGNRAYTEPILAEFRSALGLAGGRVRPAVEFDQAVRPDYQGLALRLGRSDAVLILANGYDAALVGQALAREGFSQPVLATPWSMTPEFITLGGRQAERFVFASLYDAQSATSPWVAFRESFTKLWGAEPGFAALNTADALTVLVLALERVSNPRDPEALREALRSAGEVAGLQSAFEFDPSGDVVRPLYLQTVRGGQFVRGLP